MIATLKVLAFLLWGNFLPPIASMILGDRFSRPLDHGRRWFDGQPLLGSHKTIRGILACLAGGTAVYPLLGVEWWVASLAALFLMAGDLLSSFIKRRLRHESGSSMPGLDQFFEGLFPALFLGRHLALTGWQILIALLLFIPIAHAGALFWKGILFRPPLENYPRIVRSTVRLREWRSCHQPLVRWHVWFNLSNILYNRVVVTWFFKLLGRYEQGLANAARIETTEHDFHFVDLPPAFDGFRILLLTDLHLDGLPGITEAVIERVKDLRADLCLIGGDIRMETYGPIAPCLRRLRQLLRHIRSSHGTYAVLGNHDCIEMVPDFEEAGMLLLINDAVPMERHGETLWLAGVDDPHYYRTHDVDLAFKNVPPDAFAIFLAHSPEAYKEAAAHRARLYLCGHTHGGQIRLPNKRPVYTNSRAPRFTAAGHWEYQGMTGYTSRGAGTSGAPLRFNCPAEICLFTLHAARR